MNRSDLPQESSVVVLGGGPAGATVSALLAHAGHQVLLLERERFPRFHIGESLIPETYWTLQKLGVLEKLRSSSSPVKVSVQFISESGRASRPFYFFERKPGESAYTWQVERSWFDQMLLENAAEKGVDVRLGVTAKEILFEGERALGVRASTENGREATVRSRVLVDATGLSSLVSRQLGLRKRDPYLGKAAVFSHYQNALRDSGIDEGATLVIHTAGNRGWFWYIPLSENRVSVGVVGSPEELFTDGDSKDDILAREIDRCPAVASRLEKARQVFPARVVSDYTYRATRCSGDGWVLVGDAYGFIDPIYSTGVFLALKSGEMAAETISESLRRGDCSGKALGCWGPKLTDGMNALRQLVYAFYTPGFSFARFVQEHPEHRDRLTDLLIGDVFKEGVTDIFEDLKTFCNLPADSGRS
ncbi:MAG TPA: NAD(P)/FAD-dependent oxidoreductase [Vicinamibacteria bacterium]|nr:NAD(P)/FAD-dependent oxidoreductase [Vicinamibacteria bacterium]